MFCLCFAGATFEAVQDEKSLPHVLNIGVEISDVTDTAIADISLIPEVTAVIPILEIPATIKIDESMMEVTLTGIDSNYFNETFIQGGKFPENSIMPYIVMNEAAGAQIVARQDVGGFVVASDVAEIDWLSETTAISTAEEEWIVSKIAGVLVSDEL